MFGSMSDRRNSLRLPINVMVMEGVPSNDKLAKLGVARVSYGPIPYIETMEALQKKASKLFS